MMFIDGKMCYYMTSTVWEELQILEGVHDSVGAVADVGGVNVIDAAGGLIGEVYSAVALVFRLSASLAIGSADGSSVVLKGHREFWEGVSRGGVMSGSTVTCQLVSVGGETSQNVKFVCCVFTNEEGNDPLADSDIIEVYMSKILEFSMPMGRGFTPTVTSCSALLCISYVIPCLSHGSYKYTLWVENLEASNDIQLKI